jgi:DNA repair protein RecN (Recombination protein N)
MLINLHVKNLALIEEADINFTDGLNILTGETGAGKSILIGSVNAALGAKVTSDFIRSGAEYGLCELTFKVDSPDRINKLKELEVSELDEGIVIISRKIMHQRSVTKVNGETRTIGDVKKIAELLIDIHGQNEHQSLLYKENYVALIDRYAGSEILPVHDALKAEYKKYTEIKEELAEYDMDSGQSLKELSYLSSELRDIEMANLREGEDIELEAAFKKYNNSMKIVENMENAYNVLNASDDSVFDKLGTVYRYVYSALKYDEELNNIAQQIKEAEDILNGLSSDIGSYISAIDFDSMKFNEIEKRLSLINSFKQKYGNSIEAIKSYAKEQQQRLDKLENFEKNKTHLQEKLAEEKEKVLSICEELSAHRKRAAEKLAADITDALKELNFLDVRFEITNTKLKYFGVNGFDEFDFMISTNPGEELKPLSKVASGGELSRIMLAIKSSLADKDDIEALIFDEIDTGISGRTAQMVSQKLNEISRTHQVICITHLPQIASMADEHFLIEKNVNNGTTKTTIKRLDKDACVLELARLLGGVSITENVINNAKEMKDLALQSKTSK